eukprot:m.113059 g.113059  ORF g.113059 m.113059 type:complete len:1041 (-) comp9260_c0_seq7:232-3354(-)
MDQASLLLSLLFGLVVLNAAYQTQVVHAHPSYVPGCQLSIGDNEMETTVVSVSPTNAKCTISGVPDQYIPNTMYTLSTVSTRNEFLASTNGGTFSGASKKSGCANQAVYGTIGSSFNWIAPSSGDVKIIVTCGKYGALSQSFVTSTIEMEVTCSSPPTVAHGTTCSSATSFSPSCAVTCNNGYEVTSNTLACTNSGSFSGSATCSEIVCSSPPSIAHGTTCTAASVIAPDCEVTCDTGYELNVNTLMCTQSKAFSGSASCSIVTCTPPSVMNGQSCMSFEYNGPCDIICDDGYMESSNTFACNANGMVSGSASCDNIDACQMFGSECSVHSAGCMDIDGGPNSIDGITCGDCDPGYEGDGFICTDIDGCSGDPCPANTMCTDISAPDTGFTCTCNSGFYESTGQCLACTKCLANEYGVGTCGGTSDNISCQSCPENAKSTAGSEGLDSCKCILGYERVDMGDTFICNKLACEANFYEDITTGMCVGCSPSDCPGGMELTGECTGTRNTLACVSCNATSFRVDRGTSCTTCQDGTQASSDRTMCEPCPSNTAGVSGVCGMCGLNEVVNADRTSCVCDDSSILVNGVCEQCGDGREPDEGQLMCVWCGSGSAGSGGMCSGCGDGEEPNGMSTVCVACGGVSAGTGGECVDCPAGMVPTADRTSCVMCDAMMYRGEGDASCSLCGDGMEVFANQTGCGGCGFRKAGTNGVCSMCGEKQVPSDDKTMCVDCDVVSLDGLSCVHPLCGSRGDIFSTCQKCTENGCECPLSHMGLDDGVTCMRCPVGQTSSSNGQQCVDCPMNTAWHEGRCRECPVGFGVNDAGSYCVKCVGEYYMDSGACVSCGAHMISTVDGTGCEASVGVDVYAAIGYDSISSDAAVEDEISSQLIAFFAEQGVYIVSISFSQPSSSLRRRGMGVTMVTAETASRFVPLLDALVKSGSVKFEIDGTAVMVGDVVDGNGVVLQSSASSNNGPDSSSQSSSTSSGSFASSFSFGEIFAVFLGSFIVVFLGLAFILRKSNTTRKTYAQSDSSLMTSRDGSVVSVDV